MRKGYDTVNLFLSDEHLPIGYSLENYIDEKHITHRVNSKEERISSTAKMDNLIIIHNRQGLSIRNSFCKFCLKGNLKSFCEFELMEIFQSIGDTYGIDIFKAKVTRLDFFYDILMNHNPAIYMKLLLSKSRFKVHRFEFNKYFKTNAVEYGVYDKSKEMKEYGNILRFELRLKKGVKKKLNELGMNLSSLTAQDLCTLSFRLNLEKILINGYLSIKKDELSLSRADVINTKSLKRYIMQTGIKSIGIEKLIKEIDAYKKVKYIKSHQSRRLKNKLLEINNTETHNGNANHFINEFDTKMVALQKLQV
jgi:hypothetical protein